MVSINTNLSAIIAQQNMAKATNRLNIAFERLTSGYKINHASDDAANYSVANSMSVKISSWDVACENVNLGNDMAETAQGALSIMQEHATRIHNLITQAQNGTYDQQSLNAINTEVQSRIDEIDRLYNMTEYNGLYLFHDNATMASGGSSSSATDFIESITSVSVDPNAVVSSTNTVEDIINAGYTTIGIQDAAGMADFADYVSGTGIYSSAHDCQGLTFVMMNDIDMDDYIFALGR